jgi:hypothetical protein
VTDGITDCAASQVPFDLLPTYRLYGSIIIVSSSIIIIITILLQAGRWRALIAIRHIL